MNTRTRKSLCALAATALVAGTALAATSGTALADPPTPRPIVGVGSDTTDPVMNALAEAITIDGSKPLGSFDALGPTFNSRNGAVPSGNTQGCEYLNNQTTQPQGSILRPNGSGNGRNALIASNTSGNPRFGCVDFARSSSLNQAKADVQLTYIPFALDGLTYAVRRDSIISKSLSKADLTAIYRCEFPDYVPLIPQRGSGTRGSWLQFVGLSDSTIPDCVKDTYIDPADGASKSVQEHDGRGLVTKTSIVPFAAGQWSAQSVGAIPDRRFEAVLGGIGGVPAIAVNPGADNTRLVFNVLPTARINGSAEDALLNRIFVGSTSEVCKQKSTIGRFGLATIAECGSDSTQTTK